VPLKDCIERQVQWKAFFADQQRRGKTYRASDDVLNDPILKDIGHDDKDDVLSRIL
jgi:hypothetical protein